MGWDAFSSTDPLIRQSFLEAESWVAAVAGSADMLLRMGALDCSACQWWLTKVTGDSCYGDEWPPDKVKEFQEKAVWPEPLFLEPDVQWSYWSARKFLEVCAQHNLSIRFSW